MPHQLTIAISFLLSIFYHSTVLAIDISTVEGKVFLISEDLNLLREEIAAMYSFSKQHLSIPLPFIQLGAAKSLRPYLEKIRANPF